VALHAAGGRRARRLRWAGACTDAGRRAALWLHGVLRARGHEAWVETRWVRPQRAAALALACLAFALQRQDAERREVVDGL
jgi:hypothetical protein